MSRYDLYDPEQLWEMDTESNRALKDVPGYNLYDPSMLEGVYDPYPSGRPQAPVSQFAGYVPTPPPAAPVTNPVTSGQAAPAEKSKISDAGDAAMMSGNPYLAGAGGVMKVIGAYQDETARRKAAREAKRRLDRQEAFTRAQTRIQNKRAGEAHDANMRQADFNFGSGYQDRLLQLAAYKGV